MSLGLYHTWCFCCCCCSVTKVCPTLFDPMDYNTKGLYVILIKNKPTAPLQSTLTRTWDGGAVVIADLLALEQKLLKAVSPNTFLLDTLGWWWWKVPIKSPSSHQVKRGQCLSTGTSLCGDLPRAHLDRPHERMRVPGIHPDPWLSSRLVPPRTLRSGPFTQAAGTQAFLGHLSWAPRLLLLELSLSLLSSRVYLAALCPLGFVFRSSCSGSFSGWAWLHTASPLPDPSVPGSFRQNSRLTKLQPPAPTWPLRRDSSSAFHMAEQVNHVVGYTALAPEWETGVRKPLVSDLGWSPSLTCHHSLVPPQLLFSLVWGTSHMRFPLPGRLLTPTLHHSDSSSFFGLQFDVTPLGIPHCCVPQPWPESRRCRFFLLLCHPAPLPHLHERCMPHCTAQFRELCKNSQNWFSPTTVRQIPFFKYFNFFIQLLKVIFHLQLSRNIGCIPSVVEYIFVAYLPPNRLDLPLHSKPTSNPFVLYISDNHTLVISLLTISVSLLHL